MRFVRVVFGTVLTFSVVWTGCVSGPDDVGEICAVEGKMTEDLAPHEVIIDVEAPECASNRCLAYNEHSFCTASCETDDDCMGIAGEEAYCEAEITVGDPGVPGTYCVPARASTMDR